MEIRDLSQILYVARWELNDQFKTKTDEKEKEKSNNFFSLVQMKVREDSLSKETLQYILKPIPSQYTVSSFQERKERFHQNLLNLVNKSHHKFLSLQNKQKKISKTLPVCWDESYNVEKDTQNVPDKILEDYVIETENSLENSSPKSHPINSLFSDEDSNSGDSQLNEINIDQVLKSNRDLQSVPVSLIKKVVKREIQLEKQEKEKPKQIQTRLQLLSLLPDLCKKLKGFFNFFFF